MSVQPSGLNIFPTIFLNGIPHQWTRFITVSIQKYGWKNIETTWLHTHIEDLNQAAFLEKEAIKEHRSNEREYGYNLANGGQGGATNKYNHAQIYQYWLEGNNIVEITAIIGCSNVTVRRVLDEYGVPSFERRSRQNKIQGKPKHTYDHEVILQDWLSGMSTVEVCKKHSCSRGTVQIVLNNANISLELREQRRKEAAAKTLSNKY